MGHMPVILPTLYIYVTNCQWRAVVETAKKCIVFSIVLNSFWRSFTFKHAVCPRREICLTRIAIHQKLTTAA